MKTNIGRREFLVGSLGTVISASGAASRLKNTTGQNVNETGALMPPANLRCEYLVDPAGIDVREPRLFWELQDTRRGARQTAYRILVASSPELLGQDQGDLWDTGRVQSNETIHVAYEGRPLKSRMRCYWKVQAWLSASADNESEKATLWSKPAVWSMGLLDPSDWQAKWIADPSPIPPPLPPHQGYRSGSVPTPEAQKWVILDLKALTKFDGVRLFGASSGIHGFLFPLRFRVDVSRRSDFAEFKTIWDQSSEDFPNPGVQPLTRRFHPVTGRYIRLLVTRLRPDGDGGYGFALAEMAVLSEERNLARGAEITALDSTETENWSTRKLVDGDIRSHAAGVDGSGHHAIGRIRALTPPAFRREFTIPAEIRRATIYVTALGLYELHINGRRVGDHILAPEWTDYEKCVNYQTYDVTKLVSKGENAIGVLLGDGWYAGRIAHVPFHYLYGNVPHLKAQLEIELADGTNTTIITDGTWRYTTDGPIRRSGIYEGEVYDSRREMPGWDRPGFNDADWQAVNENDRIETALTAQINEPIRIVQELPAKVVSEPHPGVYVFDLGQNIVGWVRFRLRGNRGKIITLRHSEMLAPDGTLYTAYHRTAFQDDRYIAKGDPQGETFEPHFTFHGFRYVEVHGLESKPEARDLAGQVFHSAARQTGFLETSSALVNKVWENTMWSQRGDLQGVLIDCPQRDERLPWVCGDFHSFAYSALMNMDMAASYTRRARDIRQAQFDDGRYPAMAPNIFHWEDGSPGWSDEGVLVPWVAYIHYGDKRLVEDHFESARRWVEWIRPRTHDLIWNQGGGNDWLNGDSLDLPDFPSQGAAVEDAVFATMFFAYSTRLVSKMAAVLGREETARQYEELFQSIKQRFNGEFVDQDGRVKGDTQAGYAMALNFDLLPEALREQAVLHMIEGIKRYRGHVSTGFIATHRMLLELSYAGHHELACELMHVRTCPSWGFMIDQNATTIWERWDAFVPGREMSKRHLDPRQLPLVVGFQDTGMTSFNHCALGSVVEWMYRVVLGVEPDERNPAYQHFTIRPLPGGKLTYAKGAVHSIRGPIEVHWRSENGVFKLDVGIPPNTAATLHVPAKSPERVREGEGPASQAAGVQFLRMDGEAALFEVAAGQYHFESR